MVSGGAVVMMVSGGAVVMMVSGGAVVMMVSGGAVVMMIVSGGAVVMMVSGGAVATALVDMSNGIHHIMTMHMHVNIEALAGHPAFGEPSTANLALDNVLMTRVVQVV